MNFNFGLANKFGGQCIMRFDDTNPEAEKGEYIGQSNSRTNLRRYHSLADAWQYPSFTHLTSIIFFFSAFRQHSRELGMVGS